MATDPTAQRFAGLPREPVGEGRIVVRAASRRAKRRGLAHLDSLPPDQALHISKCRAVHTFGMRFALDLIWLGSDGAIVRIDRDVGPGRMRICTRAQSVIETAAGEADGFAKGLGAEGRRR